MLRPISLVVLMALAACGTQQEEQIQFNGPGTADEAIVHELTSTVRYNAFDTTMQVLFTNTTDKIDACQEAVKARFMEKQDSITPEVLDAIFVHYKESYESYRNGWKLDASISDEELELYCPKPSTAQNLKHYITPAILYIPSKGKCEEGSFGIEFDCTWDVKSGLGVVVKNWKVQKAGIADLAYQP